MTPLLFRPEERIKEQVSLFSGSPTVISVKSETDRFRVPGVYAL